MGRRRFLRAAGVATVGVWVAPSVVSLSPALAAASPGPDGRDEQHVADDAGDGDEIEGEIEDAGDEAEVDDREEQLEDVEVLDRALNPQAPGGAPSGDTSTRARPTRGRPTRDRPAGGTPGRDDSQVLGATFASGEPPLPRTGFGRNALLGAGSAAVATGATLLRVDPSQHVPAGDTDPSGAAGQA